MSVGSEQVGNGCSFDFTSFKCHCLLVGQIGLENVLCEDEKMSSYLLPVLLVVMVTWKSATSIFRSTSIACGGFPILMTEYLGFDQPNIVL